MLPKHHKTRQSKKNTAEEDEKGKLQKPRRPHKSHKSMREISATHHCHSPTVPHHHTTKIPGTGFLT